MLVKEVQNNNYDKYNFGAKFPKKTLKTDSSFFTLRGEMSRQLSSIVSSFNDMFSSLKKLELQKTNDDAQYALMGLCEKFGIKKVAENVGEGITFSKGQKDLIVSTHGVDSIRFREVEPKTGEVRESIFIHGKKYVKTDTRDNVYQQLQYWRNDEFNGTKFERELQTRFDDVDFDILKVRREMSKPEFAKFLKVAEGSEIQAQVNKAIFLKPIVTETEQAKPKKKILSAYEKILLQRAEQAVKRKQPSIDFYNRPDFIPDDIEIDAKELPPIVEKKVSKRGRKPKNIDVVSVKPKIKTEKKEEVARVEKLGRVGVKHYAGFLSEDKKAKVDDLVSVYDELHKNFAGFHNRSTLTRIKNDYPNIEVVHHGRNSLILTDVSEKYPRVEIKISKLADKKDKFLVIFSQNTEGTVNKVAINIADGSVLKKLNNKLAHTKEVSSGRGIPSLEYYSQDELKNFDTSDLIEPLIVAIKKCNSYVVERMGYLGEKKRFSSVGKVKDENANIVADVASLFSAIREKLMSLPNSMSRSKLKYENGMLIKDENVATASRGLRFHGGGDDVLETSVNIKAYGSSGDVLCVKTKKADGAVESCFVNISRGTVYDHEPKFKVPQKKSVEKVSSKKEHHAPMSQLKVDENDFVGALSPLKKLLSEYLNSISVRVDDFLANKTAPKFGRPKKTEVTQIVEDVNVMKKRGRSQKVTSQKVNEESKVAKRRGRPKKIKSEVAPQKKVNVQAEVAQFLMNGLKEIGENLKTLQKQFNKLQKDLQKMMDAQNK